MISVFHGFEYVIQSTFHIRFDEMQKQVIHRMSMMTDLNVDVIFILKNVVSCVLLLEVVGHKRLTSTLCNSQVRTCSPFSYWQQFLPKKTRLKMEN
jgi:hypothetical protein